MNVPPEHASDVGVPVDHLPESLTVFEAYLVHPVRADIDGVMVQANHGGQARVFRQGLVQERQLVRRKLSMHFPVYGGIQHNEVPAPSTNCRRRASNSSATAYMVAESS